MQLSDSTIEELRAQVCLDGVKQAREIVGKHLPATPLIRHPVLARETGLDLYLKHENHLPTGAFKIRGGINYIANLPEELRRRGVTSATRGNHGQSIALASSLFGVRCVIVVPEGNNPEKNAAMKAYGAELIEHGSDYDEARLFCETLEESEGLYCIHGANSPTLLNGVGTYSLEIHEDLPEIETLIVPVGGGSGICGSSAVFRALKPDVQIIGVQAERAPAIYNSWTAGKMIPADSADTFADGLATRVPFELPFAIMKEGVDRMILVTEEEIREAIRLLLRTTHNLSEGAGAASVAAAIKLKGELEGRKVVAVISGGNIDAATLRWVLAGDDE